MTTHLQKTAWCPTCDVVREIYRVADSHGVGGHPLEGAVCCKHCHRVLLDPPPPRPPDVLARELALAAAEEELIQARATVAALERIVERLRG